MSEATKGAKTLFDVSFASAMTEDDLGLLTSRLGLTTHVVPHADLSQEDARFARLDNSSSLFLQRGASADQWNLQARTWGKPSSLTVHDWHVVAAYAAKLLDATVMPPERHAVAVVSTPERFVSAAQNKRLSGIRRRLVGMT